MGVECYTPAHLAISLGGTALAAVFFVLCGFHTVFFFESHPFAHSLSARAHGRSALILLVVELVLVMSIDIAGDVISPVGGAVVCLVGGGTWMVSTLFFMPFLHHGMNAAHAGGAALISFLSIAALASILSPAGSDPTALLVLGSPMSFALGVAAAYLRRARIHWMPMEKFAGATSSIIGVFECELVRETIKCIRVHVREYMSMCQCTRCRAVYIL